MPKNFTSRPSSVAARATTAAPSCTPCPPMPVMSSSYSAKVSSSFMASLVRVRLAPREAGSSDRERDKVLDVVARRMEASLQRVFHLAEREVVDGVGVARRIAAGGG